MKIVISLGGSIILKEGKVNEKFLSEFTKLLESTNHKYQIICGGGSVARVYTNTNLSEVQRDLLGIDITHVNAKLVSFYFKHKTKVVFKNPLDVGKEKGKFVISAGWKPGVNTTYDAALICKTYKPDLFINISNVRGIYDKDPNKYKGAKMIKEMSYNDFLHMAKNFQRKPGINFIFDPTAMKIISKEKVKSVFVDSSIPNLKNVLQSKKFIGTVVQ